MDPVSLGIGAVGLATSLFGSLSASGAAKQAASINQNIATQEQLVNNQRQIAMNLSARRQSLENFRNVQRVRAAGTAAAVNQGAQFGSGLSGGQASATDQGLFNAQGINQNQQIGNQIFGIDQNITNDKIALAGVQSSEATDQGIAAIGGAITKSAPMLSSIGKGIG